MAVRSDGILVNVGCGASPTRGWVNFDNSMSVRLAHLPWLRTALLATGIISRHQSEFMEVVRSTDIRYAKATRLPLGNQSCRAVYSSHMLEHLSRQSAKEFLREAFRVLEPGGILRLVVPDLRKIIDRYGVDRDADQLVARTLMALEDATLRARLRLAVLGPRNHRWMYDGASLVALVASQGFEDAKVMRPGDSSIRDPGHLDLREREEDSVFVEARSP